MSAPRISLPDVTPDAYADLGRLTATVEQRAEAAGLDARLCELVRIRASQINGCSFCLALHTDAARAHGETPDRLDALAGWVGSPRFTGRERAALAVAEAVTLIHDGGVPDDVYRRAIDEFGDPGAALLLWIVTVVNAYNRLAIATGLTGPTGPPGGPGRTAFPGRPAR